MKGKRGQAPPSETPPPVQDAWGTFGASLRVSDEKMQGEAGLPFQNPTLGAAIGRRGEDGLNRPGGPGPTRDSGFFSSTRVAAAAPPCTSDPGLGDLGKTDSHARAEPLLTATPGLVEKECAR